MPGCQRIVRLEDENANMKLTANAVQSFPVKTAIGAAAA
jgi:hypothetical protein